MPWLLPSPPHTSSPSPCQRYCERTAFAFYCAVRDQLPAWLLEDMRSMEVFLWDDGHPRSFSPGDALMYALVHDHQDYARYLLHSFSVKALHVAQCGVCRSGGSAHLHVAVRYNRTTILSLMVDALKDSAPEGWRQEYLNSCGGCAHGADAGKTAVQLAVELSRADCLLLLLAHGARPHALDAALLRLATSGAAERRDARQCLDLLLLFAPRPAAPCRLLDEPQRWQSLLGRDVFGWLSGQAPPPLLLQALRTLAQSVPCQMSQLPAFLRPHSELTLDFPLPDDALSSFVFNTFMGEFATNRYAGGRHHFSLRYPGPTQNLKCSQCGKVQLILRVRSSLPECIKSSLAVSTVDVIACVRPQDKFGWLTGPALPLLLLRVLRTLRKSVAAQTSPLPAFL